jgi:hypothetical protein
MRPEEKLRHGKRKRSTHLPQHPPGRDPVGGERSDRGTHQTECGKQNGEKRNGHQESYASCRTGIEWTAKASKESDQKLREC